MKPSSRTNYKVLHRDCEQQSADKDQLIALLQRQVMGLQEETQSFKGITRDLQEQTGKQSQELAEQQLLLTLKDQTIAAQADHAAQQQIIITKQDNIIGDQQRQLKKNKKDLFEFKLLRYQWLHLRRMIYGRSSEKRAGSSTTTTSRQLAFEVDTDIVGVVHLKDVKTIPEHTRVQKGIIYTIPHPGRHEFPDWMERRVNKPDQEVPPGARKVRTERTERLACSMMQLWVEVWERDIYIIPADDYGACKQLIAPLPSHPIPKCKADISLLVTLVIEKYLYHLPVYRQQQRFKQYGIDLPYNTLCGWISQTIDLLEPLWALLIKELIDSGYIHFDETRYRVLDDSKKKGKKSHNGYLWAVGNALQRVVCFLYKKGRGKDEVKDILTGFQGYLCTDAYSAYDKYGQQPGVFHQQCLGHARRYFDDAADNDPARSAFALDRFFGLLYGIERYCKEQNLCYDEITVVRQERSVPVLNQLRDWLMQELPKVIRGTPIHKAITYTLKRFKQLSLYTTDGMLQIDNMFIERAIRPVAVGRRNYLFAGSHRGGERAAIIYSLVETCKLHGIDPAKWLDDVLRRISDHPKEKLIQLLPQCWKPQNQHRSLAITG